MDKTFVKTECLNTIEDMPVFLTLGLISLVTLRGAQIESIEKGILTDDQIQNANTIIWNIESVIKLYNKQLSSVLELLPDDYTPEETLNLLQKEFKNKIRKTKRDI